MDSLPDEVEYHVELYAKSYGITAAALLTADYVAVAMYDPSDLQKLFPDAPILGCGEDEQVYYYALITTSK
jgi:hypothetical protein